MKSWFAQLTDKQITQLLSKGTVSQYKQGQEIFGQGDRARGFFLIQSGRVKIAKISPEGKEQLLHIFEEGEPIGEVPIFCGESYYPASAVALTECTLHYLGRETFIQLIREEPEIAMGLLGILSKRLIVFNQIIEDLSLKEVSARLAKYLLELTKEQESKYVTLDIPKGQLASRLGTVAETLSRTLRKLAVHQIIEMDQNTIKVLDVPRLEAVAEGEKI